MTSDPDMHELARDVAIMEQSMATMRAENETLRADLTATLAGMRTDMATHREDAAKRETRLVFYMVAIVGIGLTIFGFITA